MTHPFLLANEIVLEYSTPFKEYSTCTLTEASNFIKLVDTYTEDEGVCREELVEVWAERDAIVDSIMEYFDCSEPVLVETEYARELREKYDDDSNCGVDTCLF